MNQADLVQRVVAEVVRRLATDTAARSESKAVPQGLILTDAVVTEAVLSERAKGQRLISVGAKSIVTPSARDWLRRNQVELRQIPLSSKLPRATVTRTVIVQSGGSVTEQVCRELAKSDSSIWACQNVGCSEAAAKASIKEISESKSQAVIVLSNEADSVACFANRNDQVRAAVVATIGDIERVKASLKPNVFVMPVGSKGAFELLRLIRKIV